MRPIAGSPSFRPAAARIVERYAPPHLPDAPGSMQRQALATLKRLWASSYPRYRAGLPPHPVVKQTASGPQYQGWRCAR